jgi:hypothetical protein
MLRPADAGRYFDLRQLGRLSFNDRDATCMCPLVVSKSSFQIARRQEVVDEDGKTAGVVGAGMTE